MGTDQLPQDLVDGLDIRGVTPLSGGDIADAYRLDTPQGPLFLKTAAGSPGMFEAEAAGLEELRGATELGVPEVVRVSSVGLVLSWIEIGGRRTAETEAALGAGLAQMHARTQDCFGGPGTATTGYLGAVRVDNTPTGEWAEFYLDRRLRPLTDEAVQRGHLSPEARQVLDRLEPRIVDLCGPTEPPALLHGDLWSGNRVVDSGGRNWIIDPAVHYGHREIDLAMMQMFGGFGPQAFEAYDAAMPLADGWEERVPWYQLTPLLVHAILFGGGYGASAFETMRRYL